MSVGHATIRGLRQVTMKDENEKKTNNMYFMKAARRMSVGPFNYFKHSPWSSQFSFNIIMTRCVKSKAPLLSAVNILRPIQG